jgi:hypothetical protein
VCGGPEVIWARGIRRVAKQHAGAALPCPRSAPSATQRWPMSASKRRPTAAALLKGMHVNAPVCAQQHSRPGLCPGSSPTGLQAAGRCWGAATHHPRPAPRRPTPRALCARWPARRRSNCLPAGPQARRAPGARCCRCRRRRRRRRHRRARPLALRPRQKRNRRGWRLTAAAAGRSRRRAEGGSEGRGVFHRPAAVRRAKGLWEDCGGPAWVMARTLGPAAVVGFACAPASGEQSAGGLAHGEGLEQPPGSSP